jgi:translation elongation factor EF-1beta
MKVLEQNVRKVEMDGLTWGAGKLVAVGFGIKKLQINLVVEDEKVSIDDLQAKVEEDEDNVQSTDVVCNIRCLYRGRRLTLNRLPCKSCKRAVRDSERAILQLRIARAHEHFCHE